MNRLFRTTLALAALIVIAGCADKEGKDADRPAVSAPQSPGASSVKPTGDTIVVELYSDEKGNYFKPNKLEAHRGDVIRFTLMAGVHNVHFLPDSNPGKRGLPAASDLLQLPGQTYDFVVDLAEGKYFFQCDPHALLGMVGHLEVEDEK
jgi:plastocyanin